MTINSDLIVEGGNKKFKNTIPISLIMFGSQNRKTIESKNESIL